MQKSYRKNIQRDFRSNLNRFLSLFGIVALGVMMLPKNGEAYKFTKDAAKTIKQEAENVMDSMSGMH